MDSNSLLDLRGILQVSKPSDDERAQFEKIIDFLSDLPELSAWDLRAWDETFYPDQMGATASDLQRTIMKHALLFLCGVPGYYFDALISFRDATER